MRKLSAVVVALVMVFADLATAQVSTSAVPFLLIAPNSRASGLGESGVAMADDAWAQFWNPAGYAFQTGSEVSISHANWLPAFNLPDLWIAHMIYKQDVEDLGGTVSAGITYLNLGEFVRTLSTGPDPVGTFKAYEFAITVGYATKIAEEVGLGVNARFIHSRLAPFGTAEEQGRGIASGASFDVGVLYKPQTLPFTDIDLHSRLSLGANLSNIGPNLTYIDKAQSDPLPMNFRFGFAYQILESEFNNLSYDIDINKLLIRRRGTVTDPFYKAIFTSWIDKPFRKELREFDTAMGFEYWYGSEAHRPAGWLLLRGSGVRQSQVHDVRCRHSV